MKLAPNDDKPSLRRTMLRRRVARSGRAEASAAIADRLMRLPHWSTARVVASYVAVRSEVATQDILETALAQDRTLVVPFCQGSELGLCRIDSLDQLAPGQFAIPEPLVELRADPRRQHTLDQVDLIVVPGVAFTRVGDRLGYGQGYFDRLLVAKPPRVPSVGLCFDCQLVDTIPTEPSDVAVDLVITESACYGTPG